MVYVYISPPRLQSLWSSAWGSFTLARGLTLAAIQRHLRWKLLMTTFFWSCDFSPTLTFFQTLVMVWSLYFTFRGRHGDWISWKRVRGRGVDSNVGKDLYFHVFICLQKAWGQCFPPPGWRTSLGHWTKDGGSLLGRQCRNAVLINDISPPGIVTEFGVRQMGI